LILYIYSKKKKLLETENPDDFSSTEQERYLYNKLKINISAVEQEQKELFLTLFQRFEMILKNFGDKKDAEDKMEDVTTDYTHRILLGAFKIVGRKYYKYLLSLSDTLDILLSQTDPVISSLYQSWKSVMTYY